MNAVTNRDIDSSAIEAVGKMLSSNFGINVICAGDRAYMNRETKTIHLPAMPDTVSPEYMSKMRYYLDHEVGHFVGRSNDECINDAQKAHNEFGETMINALEDVRCESMMSDRWQGCDFNFHSAVPHVRKMIEDNFPVEQGGSLSDDQLENLFAISPYLMARYPDIYEAKVRPLLDVYEPVIESFREEIETIPLWAKTTRDLLDLTDRICTAYKDPDIRREQDEQDNQGNGNGGGAGGAAGSGGGNNNNTSDRAGGGAGLGGSAPKQQQALEETPDRPAPKKPFSIGDAMAKQVEEESQNVPLVEITWKNARYPVSLIPDVVLRMDADECTKILKTGFDAAANTNEMNETNKAIIAAQAASPNVRKTSFRTPALIEASCDAVSGRASAHMLRLLYAEEKSDWKRNLRRGKIDPGNVAKLALGTSDRVMRKPDFQEAPTSAIAVLIDMSGSMGSSNKLVDAFVCGTSIAKALCNAGHTVAIYGYGFGSFSPRLRSLQNQNSAWEPKYQESHKAYQEMSKNNSLPISFKDHPNKLLEVKSFNTPFRKSLASIACAAGGMVELGGTPTAESIEQVRIELLGRREDRKILFVLSDGDSGSMFTHRYAYKDNGVVKTSHMNIQGKDYCRLVEKRCLDSGIEVVGIGIQSGGSMKRSFQRSCNVNSSRELSGVLIKELEKLLTTKV